jgi:phage tail-like protein
VTELHDELPKELRAASVRRYLRGNLPAVYSEGPGGEQPAVMEMLQELERMLDPIVIVLDNLAAHLEPATAPEEMIDLLLEATGAPLDRTLPPQARQGLAREAARIARTRGTRAGLQLTLELAFPQLAPEVLDSGSATWVQREDAQPGSVEGDLPMPGPGAPPVTPQSSASTGRRAFEVRIAQEPTGVQRTQLARCIADHLPLGATYELTVAGR